MKKVYILYLTSKTMNEILNVFASIELAKKAESEFRAEHMSGCTGWDLYVIERELKE